MKAAPCARGQQILYAWARNAPKLELPPEVGFRVGGGGDIKYLVLQVECRVELVSRYRAHDGDAGALRCSGQDTRHRGQVRHWGLLPSKIFIHC